MDVKIRVDHVVRPKGKPPVYITGDYGDGVDLYFVVNADLLGGFDVELDVTYDAFVGHAFYDRGIAFEPISSSELEQIFPLLKVAIEEDNDIVDQAIAKYQELGGKTEQIREREERMTDKYSAINWNFDTRKTAAVSRLRQLASKRVISAEEVKDQLAEDLKQMADRAKQDASAVVKNPTNERVLAEQFNLSDITKGLDKGSKFYQTIQQYLEDNFKKSLPHIQPVLNRYLDEKEKDQLKGAYHKAFEDYCFDEISKAWETLRKPEVAPLGGTAPATPAPIAASKHICTGDCGGTIRTASSSDQESKAWDILNSEGWDAALRFITEHGIDPTPYAQKRLYDACASNDTEDISYFEGMLKSDTSKPSTGSDMKKPEFLRGVKVMWTDANSTLTHTGKVVNYISPLEADGTAMYKIEDEENQVHFIPAEAVQRMI